MKKRKKLNILLWASMALLAGSIFWVIDAKKKIVKAGDPGKMTDKRILPALVSMVISFVVMYGSYLKLETKTHPGNKAPRKTIILEVLISVASIMFTIWLISRLGL